MNTIELQEVMIPAVDEIVSYDSIAALSATQRAVMHLHGGLFSAMDPERCGPVRYYQHLASQFTENARSLAGLLRQDGQEGVVAMTSFSTRGKYMEVHELIVADSFRRHSELHVGSFVLRSLIGIARETRIDQIELDSSCTDSADALYRKFGFIKTGTTRRELTLCR